MKTKLLDSGIVLRERLLQKVFNHHVASTIYRIHRCNFFGKRVSQLTTRLASRLSSRKLVGEQERNQCPDDREASANNRNIVCTYLHGRLFST